MVAAAFTDNPNANIRHERVRRRAKAMRVAELIARLDIRSLSSSGAWVGVDKFKKAKYIDYPTSFTDWPEIDLDLLMLEHGSDHEILNDDCAKGPSVWPIDNASVLVAPDNELIFTLTSTIKPKDVRGKSYRISPYMVNHECVFVSESGSISGWGRTQFGLFNRKWTPLIDCAGGPRIGRTYYDGGSISFAPNVALGMALARRYEWSAIFAFPGGFRLRFGCSARGALRLFQDRDKEPDANRRRALLHWVRMHWRKSSSVDELRSVRRHLRGVVHFDWLGLPVCLVPSEFDLEQAA